MKYYIYTLVAFALLASCKQSPETNYFKVSGFTQGTTYSVVYSTKNARDLASELDSILLDFDMSLSTYKPESLISRINQNHDSVKVDAYFRAVFEKALEISEITNGAFDFTIAPVVNAWGFGFTKKMEITPALIDSLKAYVGYQKVSLSAEGYITKELEHVKFDGNAIAQGYSVDVLAAYLETLGITDYMVEIGGEVKAKGKSPSAKDWRIGIDKPIEDPKAIKRELEAVVSLKNQSLATSGNYRKFYEDNGVKYSHTINPKTGYPVKHSLLSATVLTQNCITADALATACMVLGLDKSMKLMEQLPLTEAYFIVSDSSDTYFTKKTSGFELETIKKD